MNEPRIFKLITLATPFNCKSAKSNFYVAKNMTSSCLSIDKTTKFSENMKGIIISLSLLHILLFCRLLSLSRRRNVWERQATRRRQDKSSCKKSLKQWGRRCSIRIYILHWIWTLFCSRNGGHISSIFCRR